MARKKTRRTDPPPVDPLEDDVDHDDLLSILEAMLFAAHEPLPARRIARALGSVSPNRVEAGLKLLAERLDERRSPAKLVELAGGFRLMTRPEYAPYLGRLFHKAERERLSPAALETLAIVAYKQPATRADVEAVRGVQAGPALKTLQEKRLVKPVGRAPVIGRPVQYGTTSKFLDLFGLASLKDLPDVFDEPGRKPAQKPALPTGEASVDLEDLVDEQEDAGVDIVPDDQGEPMQDLSDAPPPQALRVPAESHRRVLPAQSAPEAAGGPIAGLLDPSDGGAPIAGLLEYFDANDAVRGLLEAGRDEWEGDSILDLDFLGGIPAYEDPFAIGGLPFLGDEEWDSG